MENRSIVMVVAAHDKYIDERSKVPFQIAKKYSESAIKNGDSVDIINLYDDEFDIHSEIDSGRDPEIVGYQKRLKEADTIVFIYPLIFNAPPAILKAFLDRVLSPGFAYRYGKGTYKPLLPNKHVIVLSTSQVQSGKRWLEYGNTHKLWWERTIKTQLGWNIDVREFGPVRMVQDSSIEKWYKKITNLAQQKESSLGWLDWF